MKRALVLFCLVSTLVVLGVSVVSHGVPNEGYWRQSEFDDCGSSLVCAEWVWGDKEGASAVCCIDPAQVGSTSLGWCDASLRHTH